MAQPKKKKKKHNTLHFHPCCCKWLNFILFYDCIIFCVCMCVLVYPYPFMYWHLGCIRILAIVNNVAVNMGLQIPFWVSIFIFFGFIPRNEIAGSYGSSIFNFGRSFISFSIVAVVVVYCSGAKSCHPFVTSWTAACQASLSFTISWSFLNSCPLSQWCHLTISSSLTPFSSCPQSFLASGSFPRSWLFSSDGQSSRLQSHQ